MAKYLDEHGLQTFWNKIKLHVSDSAVVAGEDEGVNNIRVVNFKYLYLDPAKTESSKSDTIIKGGLSILNNDSYYFNSGTNSIMVPIRYGSFVKAHQWDDKTSTFNSNFLRDSESIGNIHFVYLPTVGNVSPLTTESYVENKADTIKNELKSSLARKFTLVSELDVLDTLTEPSEELKSTIVLKKNHTYENHVYLRELTTLMSWASNDVNYTIMVYNNPFEVNVDDYFKIGLRFRLSELDTVKAKPVLVKWNGTDDTVSLGEILRNENSDAFVKSDDITYYDHTMTSSDIPGSGKNMYFGIMIQGNLSSITDYNSFKSNWIDMYIDSPNSDSVRNTYSEYIYVEDKDANDEVIGWHWENLGVSQTNVNIVSISNKEIESLS